jgi:hypothetical protein
LQDTSRRIDGLVSPQSLWFKWLPARGFARPAKYTNRTPLRGVFLTGGVKKTSICDKFAAAAGPACPHVIIGEKGATK